MLEFKKCQICRILKPYNAEYFRRRKQNIYGLSHVCKTCTNSNYIKKVPKVAQSKEERAESMKKRSLEYSRTLRGKLKSAVCSYKQFDKKRGYENDITYEDLLLIFGKPCIYCEFPSTGFDRIDNTKGHTLSNCVPACKECNVSRMDNFTHEEMKKIGKIIKEIKLDRLLENN